jgi:hypothetical protein
MVETEAQRDRAERLTHQVAGVLQVENNIQTQNQPRDSSNAAQANERKGGCTSTVLGGTGTNRNGPEAVGWYQTGRGSMR